MSQEMRVLIAAGGTAGHINPALAIAQGIKERWPHAEIHFAGRKSGMEYRLVTAVGYPFHHIEVRGIQRSFSPKSILRNFGAAWHLAFAPAAVSRILKQVKPTLVIGAGGYVSGPIVRGAAKKGIPTAIHEQNAYPGMTNRILAKQVDLVMAPSQGAVQRLGNPGKTYVVGNPVRQEFSVRNRAADRAALSAKDRVVILSYGGSNGAQRVNEEIAKLAAWHTKNRNFLHIHATGSIEKEAFAALSKELCIEGDSHLIVQEYINDMPLYLSAADLVICRAGALTLAELAMVGRAAVLIPSPNVAANHQYFNAMEFSDAKAALVFEEKELLQDTLIKAVQELTQTPERLKEMGECAKTLARPNAISDIVDLLAELVQE